MNKSLKNWLKVFICSEIAIDSLFFLEKKQAHVCITNKAGFLKNSSSLIEKFCKAPVGHGKSTGSSKYLYLGAKFFSCFNQRQLY